MNKGRQGRTRVNEKNSERTRAIERKGKTNNNKSGYDGFWAVRKDLWAMDPWL